MIFNVTDLKQFLYCPRIPYFTYVMPVDRKITFKMKVGQESHLHVSELEERRKLRLYGLEAGERHFRLYLRSERLRLCGILDMLVLCPPPQPVASPDSGAGGPPGEGAEAGSPAGAQKEPRGGAIR